MDVSFQWIFLPGTSYDPTVSSSHINYRNYCLTKRLTSSTQDQILFRNLQDIFFHSISSIENKQIEIKSIRINSFLNVGNKIIHDPHIDHTEYHKTAIFYLNSTQDESTIVYNERYDANCKMHPKEYLDNVLQNKMTIAKSIISKENSLFMFDGYNYHSSSTPTSVMRRVAIALNYK